MSAYQALWRRGLCVALAVLAVVGLTQASAVAKQGASAGAAQPQALDRYRPPLLGTLVVTRPFSGDVGTYAAGHRGVDLAAEIGQSVVSAQSGVVTFAGNVAGRGVVAIGHADLIVTEYEPIQPSVTIGLRIAKGAVIGIVAGAHKGCETLMCLHWGARRGERYLDPMTLLQPLGMVRLVPDS